MSTQVPAPQRKTRPILLAALAVLIVAGGAGYWVSTVAATSDRQLPAWYIGSTSVLLAVAVAITVHCVQSARQDRARAAAIEAGVIRLADHVVPALAARMRDGASADAAAVEVAHPLDESGRRVVRAAAAEFGTSERKRAAAMATCANAAGRMQALATTMLADLREMEGRYDADVLTDLLRLDHSTTQAGRLADSIAVLTGARSGRRWTKPIRMESVLRGALGRISAYQRIRVHSTSDVAVVGHAAEGVIHAVAELMDNATRFSPPTEEVHVYVEEVHTGVVVNIEDSGLVMSPAALARAQRAVSAEPLDLTTMSGTRLGLAVVGQLARKHGLTVSFRSSARGGTGVVVLIPRTLITLLRPELTPVHRPAPDRPTPPSREAPDHPTADSVDEPDALPRRRRGHTLAAARRATGEALTGPPATDTSESYDAFRRAPRPARARPNAGARFGAFRDGRPDQSTAD